MIIMTHETQHGEVDFPFTVESETEIEQHPVAGPTGTRVEIIERDCEECGYDRARVAHLVLPGVYQITCMACENVMEQG